MRLLSDGAGILPDELRSFPGGPGIEKMGEGDFHIYCSEHLSRMKALDMS